MEFFTSWILKSFLSANGASWREAFVEVFQEFNSLFNFVKTITIVNIGYSREEINNLILSDVTLNISVYINFET